jgi:hypothetical protein
VKRNSTSSLLLCLILVGSLSGAHAQESGLGPTNLTSLAWLSGHWLSVDEDGRLEELWMTPAAGVMPGLNRSISADGSKVGFEFLRITEADGVITYHASPGGRCPATPFVLVSVSASAAVFENAEHDFPQRILYRREGDRLTAAIEGTVDGRERSREWVFSLVSD